MAMNNGNKLKDEINQRLKNDLWDVKIANSVINKRKSIRNRNIKIISSLAAACFTVTVVYTTLFFKPEPNQDFMTKYNIDKIIMVDDIISFSDGAEISIIFSPDIDDIIEHAINRL